MKKVIAILVLLLATGAIGYTPPKDKLPPMVGPPPADARSLTMVMGSPPPAEEPPAGLAVSNLTSGTCTDESCTDVACNSISPTGMVIVSGAFSYSALTPGEASMTVSGCGLTWAEIENTDYGSRRHLSVWKGTGTWSSSGNLTMAVDNVGGGTFQSTLYSIDHVTGYDTGTPNDAATAKANTGTSLDSDDVGTPGTGDVVFSAFAHENASNGIALTAGITQLTKIENGTGVRSFIVGYDNDPADETPGMTANSSGSNGGVSFIINVAP